MNILKIVYRFLNIEVSAHAKQNRKPHNGVCLSLAIVFVVDGHTTLGNLFDLNGLFRYYSFHLMMFAFGSGYFFKFYGGALSDFAHRAKKLLVPLYLWNVVYGVGAARCAGSAVLNSANRFRPTRCCSRRHRRSALRLEPRRVVHFSCYFSRRFSTRASAACPCDGTKTKS